MRTSGNVIRVDRSSSRVSANYKRQSINAKKASPSLPPKQIREICEPLTRPNGESRCGSHRDQQRRAQDKSGHSNNSSPKEREKSDRMTDFTSALGDAIGEGNSKLLTNFAIEKKFSITEEPFLYLTFSKHIKIKFFKGSKIFKRRYSSYKGEGSAISSQVIEFNHEADKLCLKGQFHEAVIYYDRALKLDPQSVRSYTGKAFALYKLNDLTESLRNCNEALAIDPNSYVAYNAKGSALSAQGLNKQALINFDKALNLNSDFVDAYIGKGSALCNMERYKEASSVYDKVFALTNTPPAVAYNGKGLALWKLQRSTEAIKFFDEALTLDPKYIDAYRGKLAALLHLKCYPEVVTTCDIILSIAPDVAIYNRKGSALLEIKRFKEALNAFEDALLLDSNSIEAHKGKGIALFYSPLNGKNPHLQMGKSSDFTV